MLLKSLQDFNKPKGAYKYQLAPSYKQMLLLNASKKKKEMLLKKKQALVSYAFCGPYPAFFKHTALPFL